jgi:hypothetical protein
MAKSKNPDDENRLFEFETPSPTLDGATASDSEPNRKQFIAKQLKRFGQLKSPPRDELQAHELYRPLLELSNVSIVQFVDGWIEEKREWPKPADVYDFSRQLSRNKRYEPNHKPHEIVCTKCLDVGCYVKDGRQVRCDCVVGQEFDPTLFDGPSGGGAGTASRRPSHDLAHLLRPPSSGKPRRRK